MTISYTQNLDKNPANFAPLTPLSFLTRARDAFGHRPAYAYGTISRNWGELYSRCVRYASALNKAGIGKNDTVAVLAPNIPEMFETQFAVPMSGAVMNPINTRLDADTIPYKDQLLLSLIIDADSKHAIETLDARDPPSIIAMRYHLCIAVALEAVSLLS